MFLLQKLNFLLSKTIITLNQKVLLYFGFSTEIQYKVEKIKLYEHYLNLKIKSESFSEFQPSENKSIIYSKQNYWFETNSFGIYFYLEERDSNGF